MSVNEINLPIEFLLNETFAWAVPIAVTITPSTPLHSVLIFCIRLIDKSKKTISENSENQFLVMYWYKNNIGEINLILSLIMSQKFCKTSVFIGSKQAIPASIVIIVEILWVVVETGVSCHVVRRCWVYA